MNYIAPSPTLSMWFIIATCVAWLLYELYVVYYKKQTISTAFTRLLMRHPIAVFMMGVLIGHWLW